MLPVWEWHFETHYVDDAMFYAGGWQEKAKISVMSRKEQGKVQTHWSHSGDTEFSLVSLVQIVQRKCSD